MPWPGRGRRAGALLGVVPSKACSCTVPGSVSHVGKRNRGSSPDLVCLREPSHLASRARPGFRRPGSRTRDLPARCGRSNPRATVRQRPSLESVHDAHHASRQPHARKREASCLRPLSAAPRASPVLHGLDPGGVSAAGPRRRSFETVLVDPPLTRRVSSYGVSFLVEPTRELELAAALAYPTFEP